MTNPFKEAGENITPETEIEKNDDTVENVETEVVEEVKSEETNAEVEKLKADYEQLNNQYIRLAADFENYRKRQENERENLIKYGTVDALKKLLEVLDNFDRGE